MLQDPTVPPKRNLDTHRCHHMLYKDTWIKLMLGEQQGAGVGEQKKQARLEKGMIH